VALLGEDGQPLEGYAMDDCEPIFGDDLERAVPWKDGKDLASIAGRPVRLQLELRDADLYAFHFGDGGK